MLSGKIECGECGDTYRGSRKERKKNGDFYNFYKCQARRNNVDGTPVEYKCSNCTVSREVVEKAAIDKIKELVFSVDNISQMVLSYNQYRAKKANNGEDMVKRYESQKTKLDQEIKTVIRKLALMEDERIAKEFKNLFDELESEKKNIEKRIEQENTQQQEVRLDMREFAVLFAKLRLILNSGKNEHKKRLIEVFLNKVVVFHDRIEIFVNALPKAVLGALNVEVNAKTLLKQAERHETEMERGSDTMPDPLTASQNSWLTKQCGSPSWTRTNGLAVNSRSLLPTELLGNNNSCTILS